MADFNKYEPKLKKWEGGFVNDPRDTGGATMCGVTLNTFRQFFGEDKTEQDLMRMTPEQWRAIMKGGFWDKCWADQLKNQSVAEIIVDWCINSGMGMLKRVQEIVGTKADGIMGPKTLRAINCADQKTLHAKVKVARTRKYLKIIETSPSKVCFIEGWLNRLADFGWMA